MDWWDSIVLGETKRKDEDSQKQDIRRFSKLTFVPSQHFSARGITDRNRTLWGGFAWEIGESTGYFA